MGTVHVFWTSVCLSLFFLSFAQCIDSVGVETLVGKLNCILCTVCNVNDDFNVFKLLDFLYMKELKACALIEHVF